MNNKIFVLIQLYLFYNLIINSKAKKRHLNYQSLFFHFFFSTKKNLI